MENTVVSLIPLHELEAKFAQIVEDKLKEVLHSNNAVQKQHEKEYATRKEVAKRLRISLPTLNTLTKEGILIGYRIGGRVLYKWEEVEDVLIQIKTDKHKQKSNLK